MLLLFSVALLLACVAALDNGLARTPPMGYNSWYDETCADTMDANSIKLTADLMKIHSLDALGYRYVNLDGCFLQPGDAGRVNGTLQPDAQHFAGTEGIKDLADYLHARGMLFGVYTDRGSLTCQGRVGSNGHEATDARTYAEWGVDYVKEDSCHAYGDHANAFREYGLMRDALNATGRPMLFAACGWHDWYAPPDPTFNYKGGPTLANLARIGPDDTNWQGVLTNTDIMARLAPYAGPGYFNDPCLLLSKDWTGRLRVSELQSRAQFSLWCVMSAPLLISGSLPFMTKYTLETYSNARAIAVDQIPRQGIRISGNDVSACARNPVPGANCTNVWGKQLDEASWAVVFLNAGSEAIDVTCDATCLGAMNVTKADLPLSSTDLWGSSNSTPTQLAALELVAKALPAYGGHAMLVLNSTSSTSFV